MQFIDIIEVPHTTSYQKDVPLRTSSLGISDWEDKPSLAVLGNLPHNYHFRPKTAQDRNNLVEFLNGLDFSVNSRYMLYQNNITGLSSFINKHGWEKASKLSEKVRCHLNCSHHGVEGWEVAFDQHYEHVADITAKNLHDVFRVGNHQEANTGAIVRHASMHSVSVGDLVQDNRGRTFIVCPVGFEEVEVHNLEDDS